MNEVDHALSQIADIRAQMAASTRFRGFAPEAVALTAVLALSVAMAQAIWPEALAEDDLRFVGVWVGAAVIASGIVGSETLVRSRRLHGPMAEVMISSTLRQFMPFAAAGAVVTLIICSVAPSTAWALPGLWQIIIALAGFAAVPSLPRSITWAAGWYFLCGSIVLALAGQDGGLSPWMMGIPFAIGQGLVALTLHMAGSAADGRA